MDIHTQSWLGATVQHRHGDEWYQMEERNPEHNPGDPERDWQRGRVFYCRPCDEEVRVQLQTDAGRS